LWRKVNLTRDEIVADFTKLLAFRNPKIKTGLVLLTADIADFHREFPNYPPILFVEKVGFLQ
jgi:hypothetical protein